MILIIIRVDRHLVAKIIYPLLSSRVDDEDPEAEAHLAAIRD